MRKPNYARSYKYHIYIGAPQSLSLSRRDKKTKKKEHQITILNFEKLRRVTIIVVTSSRINIIFKWKRRADKSFQLYRAFLYIGTGININRINRKENKISLFPFVTWEEVWHTWRFYRRVMYDRREINLYKHEEEQNSPLADSYCVKSVLEIDNRKICS